MPRRGSRVRSPSRALETKKKEHPMDVPFSLFRGTSVPRRVRCLRFVTVGAGRGHLDLVRSPLRFGRRRPRSFRPRAPRLAHEIEIPLRSGGCKPRSPRPRAPRLALLTVRQKRTKCIVWMQAYCLLKKIIYNERSNHQNQVRKNWNLEGLQRKKYL